MSNFDKLFHNDAPKRLGQESEYLYEAYKNEVYSIYAHIFGRYSFAVLTYNYPSSEK